MTYVPTDVLLAYQNEANTWAQHFGLDPSTAHNGQWDAFRHAYASAAMTQDYGSTIANVAGQLVELRGDWNGQPAAERTMDLFNNSVGRSLASGTTTREEIANYVHNALISGQLITSPSETGRGSYYGPGQTNYTSYYDSISTVFEEYRARLGEITSGAIGFNDDGVQTLFLRPGTTESEFNNLLDDVRALAELVDQAANDESNGLTNEQRQELSSLHDQVQLFAFEAYTALYDPLVIDLDGDGIETVSVDDSRANFNLFTEDGLSARHGWVGEDDGLLAFDRNGDGVINDIGELFGNRNESGFAELSALDSNGDGVIDANDEQFQSILIWRDRNGDGISQAEELGTLSDYGITSLSLDTTTSGVNSNGNLISEVGSYTMEDGSTGVVGDVHFAVDISTLTTNGRPDIFVFNQDSGLHRLNAFEDGLDTIQISGASFEDLTFLDQERGVLISVLNSGLQISVANVFAEQLGQDDFSFV
ncbi:hypothetical protein [Stappia sp. P2PMeth1]|uniref:DUF6973 domain-containing protein n=1 Tax=Stappia sp. P2PMeth1 TaxID=2003586 RepID=UPI001648200F|nr:hypothetical protein [Stappia sp. P2PMeth1]